MKFGKQIQSQQFTEWSAHYLDYKGLKKFISSLLNTPRSNAIGLSNGTTFEDDPSKLLQSQKAAFFFKLERELEKINSFYLQKENELKVRLRTLVDKKKVLQSDSQRLKHASTLFNAIQEAFIQFEHDLNKLQASKYVELNNEGFRKILKKWDKRSKSTTKELYLSRQIDIQPCFNTQFLSELADLASINRVELSNIQDGISIVPTAIPTTQDLTSTADAVVDDMELELVKAVSSGQVIFVREILARNSQHPSPDDRERLSRVFWHACSEATTEIMDLLIDTNAVNFEYVDDINERSCLHMASMAGRRELLEICTARGANVRAIDAYGRTALHYATMKGFSDCVSFLLTHNVDIESRDHDGFSPLIYAIMNGHTPIVDILIRAGANIEPQHSADHIPLSLACYYGHTDIALMLYEQGAKNLPNAESLYPLHLAARQGHVELCRLLSRQSEEVDRPDKYNSWTPLFWAASDGHAECVRILIEAGCQVNLKDENGKTALYYAAWEGQKECMKLLIDAGCEVEPVQDESSYCEPPPQQDDDASMALELDIIPSLSLPPPIIPFRIYGHNYLDRKYQVHISLCQPPIRLYDNTQISSLKLVISSKPDTGMIPHSVILPLAADREIFNFQVDKLDDFLLEFDIFATFGSKVLGRGAALPQMFSSTDFKVVDGYRTIPLVDGHLKVIGELSFGYAVVKPFRGVQLEIGGRIETYWKSTNTLPHSTSSNHPTPEPTSSSTALPSFITASSLSGDYVRVVVQLTKDLVPVVFANWLVPFGGLDLAVSDLTYEQFCRLGENILESNSSENGTCDTEGICPYTGNSMLVQQIGDGRVFLSLQTVLQKIPSTMGVHLELKYPYVSELALHTFANIADRNTFVDTVLQCIYDHVRSLPSDAQNTSIFFSSFNPAICTVVNWKQPNYAVFFNTYCGLNMDDSRRGTKRKSVGSGEEVEINHVPDVRCTSLKESVKFAKRNNLLGVISEATPLVQVPSLIQNIKESGLILVTFGSVNSDVRYRRIQERYGVDAMIINEVVHFNTTMAGAGF